MVGLRGPLPVRGGAAGGLEHGAAGGASAQQPRGDHRSPLRRARHLADPARRRRPGRAGVDVRTRLPAGGGARGARHAAALAFPPDRPLVCVYTSGSTGAHVACGRPPPSCSARRSCWCACGTSARHARARDRAAAPPLWPAVRRAGPVHGGRQLRARDAAARRDHRRPGAAPGRSNVLVSVPAHLHALATLPPGALPPLARIFSSGAPLDPATAVGGRALAGIPVTEVLGSSETGGIAWRESGGQDRGDGAGSRSRASTSPRTTTGRCCCAPHSSPAPTATPRAGIAAPIGSAPAHDGRFELLGRADGVVKIGGSRVAVAEIERLLREIAGRRRRRGGVGRHAAAPASRAVGGGGGASAFGRGAARRPAPPPGADRSAPPLPLVAALPREDNGKLVRARLLALFDGTTDV